jgi:hypothetical protein
LCSVVFWRLLLMAGLLTGGVLKGLYLDCFVFAFTTRFGVPELIDNELVMSIKASCVNFRFESKMLTSIYYLRLRWCSKTAILQ